MVVEVVFAYLECTSKGTFREALAVTEESFLKDSTFRIQLPVMDVVKNVKWW